MFRKLLICVAAFFVDFLFSLFITGFGMNFWFSILDVILGPLSQMAGAFWGKPARVLVERLPRDHGHGVGNFIFIVFFCIFAKPVYRRVTNWFS